MNLPATEPLNNASPVPCAAVTIIHSSLPSAHALTSTLSKLPDSTREYCSPSSMYKGTVTSQSSFCPGYVSSSGFGIVIRELSSSNDHVRPSSLASTTCHHPPTKSLSLKWNDRGGTACSPTCTLLASATSDCHEPSGPEALTPIIMTSNFSGSISMEQSSCEVTATSFFPSIWTSQT